MYTHFSLNYKHVGSFLIQHRKGEAEKKLNKHYSDVECGFLHLCAPAITTPSSLLSQIFFLSQIKNHLGLKGTYGSW